MVPLKNKVLSPDATVRDAIALIERTRRVIVAVVGEEHRLLGILSDGDIRRSILAGNSLDGPVSNAMTINPIKANHGLKSDALARQMIAAGIVAMPIVDSDGRFVNIVQIDDFVEERGNNLSANGFWGAVIMAGGEGRRLLPFTTNRPKPMIEIGGVPLLERQVRGMVAAGLKRIYISTNYLGHLIEEHFGDGATFGAEIHYLREKEKLGTAGSLTLLPERPDGPLLVVNGDVLTASDYGHFLDYHIEQEAYMSLAVIEYTVEIPFGVVKLDGTKAVGLEEKPSQGFMCNAGIYVLQPEALDLIIPDKFCNMTEIISAAINKQHIVSVFPIHEFWTDIGNPQDLERARQQFRGSRNE